VSFALLLALVSSISFVKRTRIFSFSCPLITASCSCFAI
jgi:hypothetical protein